MKKIITSILISTFISAISAQVFESKQKQAQNQSAISKSEFAKAQKDSIEEYQHFRAKAIKRMKKNDQEIIALRAKQKAKGLELNKEANRKVTYLQDRNESLKYKIDHYRADGSNNWDTFKSDFNDQLKALQNAFMESRIE
ncbi:MAG: hypothetical protein MUE96_12510 [Bacteroidia bacterium]|jgi:hypothetical protein|nr:hypothetical protein [Bacteroidia bacterium]